MLQLPIRVSSSGPAGPCRSGSFPRVARSFLATALVAVALGLVPGASAQTPPAPERPATPPGAPDANAPPITTQAEMERIFDEFFKVGLDLEKPLLVHNLVLKRDTMELTLQDGTVFLAQPIGGKVTGAYFTGTGAMRVTIPNPLDRKLMKGAYGKPVFDEGIGEAVLRFDDDTDREILVASKPGPSSGTTPPATWSDRLKVDYNTHDLQMDYLENTLNRLKSGAFFMADVHTADGKDWYDFVHRGRDRLENSLLHERAMGAAGKRWYEVLSIFHKPADYDAKGNYDLMPASDSKDIAALRNVDMTVEIPNTKTVKIDARVTVESLRDGNRSIRFGLVNNLGPWYETGRPVTLGLVTDAGGAPLPHLHRWHQLLVLLPQPLAKGERTTIHVQANEDTIIQLTEKSYWIYTDYPWFPQIHDSGGRYTFDWTVKVAKPLRAAGSGTLVKEWDEGNMTCGEWKSTIPMKLASFIFGEFRTSDGAYKREAPGSGEVPMKLFTILGGDENFKGKTDNIMFNIGQGIKMYETIYGPFPYGQLDIAEMAHGMGFAESPAGILLVSKFRDAKGGEWGLDKAGGGGMADQVIFHELAHQWWFHQIGLLGPEDAWVSESWAEYSAGLMTEAIDKKKFHDKLDEWKRLAIEADPHGTIAAAYRSDSVEYENAYRNLVYCKGPYVVHMLRTWMGWDKFTKYVGTIQSKYKGTDINTDTLAREASAVMGYDMFPFFDQWVRDKGIPKVHWSWSAAPDADGKQLVTIKVRQEDRDNPKILMVPISFDFGKGEPVVVQKPILKAETEIQVKVPTLPKAVRMDDDSTQLAIFIAENQKK